MASQGCPPAGKTDNLNARSELDLSQLHKQLAQVVRRSQALQEENVKMTNKLAELEANPAQNKETPETDTAEGKGLAKQVETLSERIRSLEQSNAEYERRLKSSQQQQANAAESNRSMRLEVVELDAEKDALLRKIEAVESQRVAIQRELQALKEQARAKEGGKESPETTERHDEEKADSRDRLLEELLSTSSSSDSEISSEKNEDSSLSPPAADRSKETAVTHSAQKEVVPVVVPPIKMLTKRVPEKAAVANRGVLVSRGEATAANKLKKAVGDDQVAAARRRELFRKQTAFKAEGINRRVTERSKETKKQRTTEDPFKKPVASPTVSSPKGTAGDYFPSAGKVAVAERRRVLHANRTAHSAGERRSSSPDRNEKSGAAPRNVAPLSAEQHERLMMCGFDNRIQVGTVDERRKIADEWNQKQPAKVQWVRDRAVR